MTASFLPPLVSFDSLGLAEANRDHFQQLELADRAVAIFVVDAKRKF